MGDSGAFGQVVVGGVGAKTGAQLLGRAIRCWRKVRRKGPETMLLAEIQGKLRGSFDCTNCGEEGAIAPGASTGIEDALTSTVFGAMRWLRPELGVLPLCQRLELPTDGPVIATIRLWPWVTAIPLLELGRAEITHRGCEPDAFIEIGEQAFVLMEAKRGWGKDLGNDPLQLPKEAIVAHQGAEGRLWRLLCVTSGTTEPRIRGFRAESGHIVQGELMQLADAVASYFESAMTLGHGEDWPSPAEVRAQTKWLSWSSMGHIFQIARSEPGLAPHEATLLDDLLDYLRRAGHLRPSFRGFDLGKVPRPWPELRWFSNSR